MDKHEQNAWHRILLVPWLQHIQPSTQVDAAELKASAASITVKQIQNIHFEEKSIRK